MKLMLLVYIAFCVNKWFWRSNQNSPKKSGIDVKSMFVYDSYIVSVAAGIIVCTKGANRHVCKQWYNLGT